MPTRRRVRRPAKPITDTTKGLRGHIKRFFLSFTPAHFRAYWLSWDGVKRLAKLAGAGVLLIFLVFLWYAKDLPSPSKLNNGKLGLTTTFYARDELTNPGHGTKLYEVHGDQNRLLINFNQMPSTIKQATIAIEDKNFYKEGAFSVTGLARAFKGVVTHDTSAGGGSTITQQYVKNALLTDQHSYSRKIKELILSIEINQFYSKDDILKLYLNEIPYGGGAYGIEAACRTYFSKAPSNYGTTNCAQHLDLSQSAMLAAIPNLPSYYYPYGEHTDALIDRQHLVLDDMAAQGYINQAEANAAKWTVADLHNGKDGISNVPAFYSAVTAPNFVYTLQDQLEQKYGTAAVEQGGWKVVTTLDPNLQKCAELSIYNTGNDTCTPDGKTAVNPNAHNNNYTNLVRSKGSNAALVAADPNNGQVLAMVGSYNFAESQVNVATSQRQPGSSFKPYVYATLFAKNMNGCTGSNCTTYGAGTVLDDSIATAESFASDYHPRDFGGSCEVCGPVTIRTALDASLNIPAVQALKLAGVPQSLATAHAMGITTLNNDPNSYGLSLVLGSGEVKLTDHVNAYESFANGGQHYDPVMALKIYDNKDHVIEDNTKVAAPKKVLDPQVAYMINNILADRGAGAFVFFNDLTVPGHSASGQAGQGTAVKTGTTTDVRDAWTIGYTPSIVAGVWAGNNDDSPMTGQAVDIAAPIWRGFMGAALTGKPIETFNKPTGLQYLPNSASSLKSTTANDFFPKWYKAPAKKFVTIDKVSGKLATDCTPDLAKEQVVDTGITDTDDVHSCDDVNPSVQINGASGGGPYNLNINVTLGTFGTTKPGTGSAKLDVYFDDQVVSTQQLSASGNYNVPYSPSASGSHTFKAVVTDTGLRQGQDEATVNVVNTGSGTSGFQGLTPTNGATMSPGSVTFSWSAESGASQYTLYIDGAPRGAPTAATTKSYPVLTPTTHTWYVKADTGDQTTPMTFTIQ
ncbi:MAG TPA: penicillin-binding protein [Candidatus Saccharimonadia bacterium]|nr:penicillin-binding protein [Candidatus Saccharimonadia bacterium]